MIEIKGGYYIKARCIQESEIQHAPPHVREIWDWFIMKANHAPYKKYGNTFNRGQLLCTYADIQDALHWTIGWRKKSYSKGDCETAMKWLKKRVMVTTRKTTKGMIVTICNYSRFQDPKNYETYSETEKKPTVNLQTDDNIYKNEEEEKEEKESIYNVFKFWNKQGIINHRDIAKSKSSINSALDKYSEEEITEAISNYKTVLTEDKYYWTHKWTLKEFLQRGLEKFVTDSNPFSNYKEKGQQQGGFKLGWKK